MREMTDDERELEQKRLSFKIQQFLGRPLNGRALEEIDEILKDHRQRCRMRGLDFPEVVAVPLIILGNLEIVPRDLDKGGIETLIVNLARKWPTVGPDELSFAINRAFPGYAKLIGAAEKAKGFELH